MNELSLDISLLMEVTKIISINKKKNQDSPYPALQPKKQDSKFSAPARPGWDAKQEKDFRYAAEDAARLKKDRIKNPGGFRAKNRNRFAKQQYMEGLEFYDTLTGEAKEAVDAYIEHELMLYPSDEYQGSEKSNRKRFAVEWCFRTPIVKHYLSLTEDEKQQEIHNSKPAQQKQGDEKIQYWRDRGYNLDWTDEWKIANGYWDKPKDDDISDLFDDWQQG